MKYVLLTNQYNGTPLDIIKSVIPCGFEIVMLDKSGQDNLLKAVSTADYILAGGRLKITEEVLDNAPNLKMIQRSGVGLDSIDLDAVKAHGIPLYVNKGVNAQSVAEHTLMLILACLRRLPEIDANTKNGIWNKQGQGVKTAELCGKTVGIIGMGSVAKTLVSLLKPFNVQILYTDIQRVPESFEKDNGMSFVTLDELLGNSDIVTLNCALTDETKHLINAEAIGKMKRGAILVNTARGGIVDTLALADALRSGKLGFSGIDVHEEEPLPNDYILAKLGNVILTPHIAGVTADSFRAMMNAAFRNIEKFDKGDLADIEQYRYL